MGFTPRKVHGSRGTKRLIAAATAAVAGVLRVFGLDWVVSSLEWIAGFVATWGLTHATFADTIGKQKFATVSAIFSTLVLLAKAVPAWAPFTPVLEATAALVGAVAVLVRK